MIFLVFVRFVVNLMQCLAVVFVEDWCVRVVLILNMVCVVGVKQGKIYLIYDMYTSGSYFFIAFF